MTHRPAGRDHRRPDGARLPIHAMNDNLRSTESKTRGMPRSASSLPSYVAARGAGLQQPIAKIALTKIMLWYQRLACANQRASTWTKERRNFGCILQCLCFHRLLRSATAAIRIIHAGKATRMDGLRGQERNVRDTML